MNETSWKFIGILIIASAIIAACGSDDISTIPDSSNSSTFGFTDGDGIPEMTADPSFSPSTVAIDSDVTVSVTVDSDTTHASVFVGIFDGTTFFIYGQTLAAVVTPGGSTGVAVTVSSGFSAVPGTYTADIVTCAGGLCTLGNAGRWYTSNFTYLILDLANLSPVGTTSSAPPTFTVP